MAGVKGRSGPRPVFSNYSLNDVVSDSIRIIHLFLNDGKISLRDKADVAARFVLKRMPDKVNVELAIAMTPAEREQLLNSFRATLLPDTLTLIAHDPAPDDTIPLGMSEAAAPITPPATMSTTISPDAMSAEPDRPVNSADTQPSPACW